MREQVDRTGLIALVIAIVAGVGMVVAVPSLLPDPLRDLVGLGPHRLGDAPEATGDGRFVFLATQARDPSTPVGYDPCQRIPVRINPEGAPSGSIDLVKRAMAEIEDLTGLKFEYQGASDQRPRWKGESVPVIMGRPRTTPVLVSWATDDEVEELAGNVAGIGGSVAIDDLGGTSYYVTGGITLDADAFARIHASEDGEDEELAIILHEFGHLVGLDHVEDFGELMNAENVGQLDFGPGDRRGLALIGAIDCK